MSSSPLDQKVLSKLMRYCAYKERCSAEVKTKLASLGVQGVNKEPIISYLKKHQYLDDQRYASAFVTGKFRINKWGRLKIKMALVSKGIKQAKIDKAMNQIDEREYTNLINQLAWSKKRAITSSDKLTVRAKISRFLASRGFETALIIKAVENL